MVGERLFLLVILWRTQTNTLTIRSSTNVLKQWTYMVFIDLHRHTKSMHTNHFIFESEWRVSDLRAFYHTTTSVTCEQKHWTMSKSKTYVTRRSGCRFASRLFRMKWPKLLISTVSRHFLSSHSQALMTTQPLLANSARMTHATTYRTVAKCTNLYMYLQVFIWHNRHWGNA